MSLDDLLRDGWAAYGRNDLASAQSYAAQAQRIAPTDPQVRLLAQRIDALTPRNAFGRGRIAIFFVVLEAATIAIGVQAFGRLQADGIAAKFDFSAEGGDSALMVALGAGAAALLIPWVGWTAWRAMR